jgi:hypothetical protein
MSVFHNIQNAKAGDKLISFDYVLLVTAGGSPTLWLSLGEKTTSRDTALLTGLRVAAGAKMVPR